MPMVHSLEHAALRWRNQKAAIQYLRQADVR